MQAFLLESQTHAVSTLHCLMMPVGGILASRHWPLLLAAPEPVSRYHGNRRHPPPPPPQWLETIQCIMLLWNTWTNSTTVNRTQTEASVIRLSVCLSCICFAQLMCSRLWIWMRYCDRSPPPTSFTSFASFGSLTPMLWNGLVCMYLSSNNKLLEMTHSLLKTDQLIILSKQCNL